MKVQIDSSFEPFPIYYLGPDLTESGVPTFLYFSISGEESLSLAPYNQVAKQLYEKGLRVISWTLPGHHEGQDKNAAMSYWMEHLEELKSFIQKSHQLLDRLFEQNIIASEHFAVGGLSRGGFIATHLLAHPKVLFALGIAPLVDLRYLSEGGPIEEKQLEGLLLEPLCENLYQKKIYYLIGNRDERVSTDGVFKWLRTLTDYAYNKRVRSPHFEMKVFPSVGYQGHGSLPYVFEEGSRWVHREISN